MIIFFERESKNCLLPIFVRLRSCFTNPLKNGENVSLFTVSVHAAGTQVMLTSLKCLLHFHNTWTQVLLTVRNEVFLHYKSNNRERSCLPTIFVLGRIHRILHCELHCIHCIHTASTECFTVSVHAAWTQ